MSGRLDSCARLPRRPRSSPTPWCAWRAGGLSKATRISANRSARRSAGRAVSRPGALAAGSLVRRAASSAGSMPTWSSGAISNIEETFAGIDVRTLKLRPRRSGTARRSSRSASASTTPTPQLHLSRLHRHGAVPRHPAAGIDPTDDLAWADERDVLIAMTCRPYRREVVEAVDRPRTGRDGDRRLRQPASPIIRFRRSRLRRGVDTPQFFPSSVRPSPFWKRC
jgi:hypothetical protein